MDDDYDDSQVEGGRGVGGDLIDSEHTHTLELGSHNLGVVYSYFPDYSPSFESFDLCKYKSPSVCCFIKLTERCPYSSLCL